MTVPSFEVLRGPIECLVQMAKVTGIGPAGLDIVEHARTADLVAADALEDAIGGMRHVAVIAITTGRGWRVMGMCGELRRLAEFLMALEARFAGSSGGTEQVVRITVVAGVTGKARKFSAFVAR